MSLHRMAYFGSSTAPDGGSELRLLAMARHFQRAFDVTLFLPDDGPLYQDALRSGIDAVNLDFLRLRRYHGMGWFGWMRSVQLASRRLATELRRRRIELIHFNDYIDMPFFPVARKVGIPSVSHLRLIVANPLARAAFQIQARRGKTLVLPVSQAVERAMLGDGPIPRHQLYDPRPDPLFFHPSGAADMDRRRKLRAECGWKEEDFVLILVSKLLENKGHLNFLRVAKELEGRSPGSFRFLMVAGSSPGREKYEARVREAAGQLPSGSLRWVPGAPHLEVAGLLRASDCFLHLPDTEDSLPSVVLEAMACGVPVVAHRLGGIPEELDEGRAGVLIPQGDVEGAAEQVETLRKEESIRRQVVEHALGRIETLFSEEAHFAALGEVYERLSRT